MLQTPKERRERSHILYRMCALGQKCFVVTAYVSNFNFNMMGIKDIMCYVCRKAFRPRKLL